MLGGMQLTDSVADVMQKQPPPPLPLQQGDVARAELGPPPPPPPYQSRASEPAAPSLAAVALPPPPVSGAPLYQGFGLRETIVAIHSCAGDPFAQPPRLALQAGDVLLLTSEQPGNGWWTAVQDGGRRCGLVPVVCCERQVGPGPPRGSRG
jgi:hypothetical protein